MFEDDQMIAVRAYERAEDRALHLSSLEPFEPFETVCLFGRCDRNSRCVMRERDCAVTGILSPSSFFLSGSIPLPPIDFLLAWVPELPR